MLCYSKRCLMTVAAAMVVSTGLALDAATASDSKGGPRQGEVTGSRVSGFVTDAASGRHVDARVTLRDSRGRVVAVTDSTRTFGYSFADVPPGTYVVATRGTLIEVNQTIVVGAHREHFIPDLILPSVIIPPVGPLPPLS